MTRNDQLFARYDFGRVLANQDKVMFDEIEALPEGRLLGTNPEELAQYFAEKFDLDLPVLREADITVDRIETKIDVSQDPSRVFRRPTGPIYRPATEFKYFVPFDGEGTVFHCQGNEISFNPPRAQVQGQELVLSVMREDDDAAAVKAEFDRELAQITHLLAGITTVGQEYNRGLKAKALARISARRERLVKTDAAMSTLGYPMRRRAGAPSTYAVPEVRRKLPPQLPPSAGAKLEPALDGANYEHILSVMANMVAVMERSPAAFSTMMEEDIRQSFLVQLNGQYEGQATGETFNGAGKTDILIRVNGKNIFIAECKFWGGPKAFDQAVTQLLGYTTWRDSKTALVIFNRDRTLSTVLEKIPELVKARAEFVRQLPQPDPTLFRFLLHHPDDVKRELIMTVMVFEVPAPNGRAAPS